MKIRVTVFLAGLLVVAGAALAVKQTAGGGVGQPAPEIKSDTWINSPPRRMADLRGKVVLVEFWTCECFNCRNVEPHVKGWHQKYADRGLVVIGVHTPELDSERDLENVRRYVREHDLKYAVAIDNDYANWERYSNRFWPALYVIDKKGVIRHVQIGEGGYGETESRIAALLAEGV